MLYENMIMAQVALIGFVQGKKSKRYFKKELN